MGGVHKKCKFCLHGVANASTMMPCQACRPEIYAEWAGRHPDLVGQVLAAGQPNAGVTRKSRRPAAAQQRPSTRQPQESWTPPRRMSEAEKADCRKGLSAARAALSRTPDPVSIDDPLEV